MWILHISSFSLLYFLVSFCTFVRFGFCLLSWIVCNKFSTSFYCVSSLPLSSSSSLSQYISLLTRLMSMCVRVCSSEWAYVCGLTWWCVRAFDKNNKNYQLFVCVSNRTYITYVHNTHKHKLFGPNVYRYAHTFKLCVIVFSSSHEYICLDPIRTDVYSLTMPRQWWRRQRTMSSIVVDCSFHVHTYSLVYLCVWVRESLHECSEFRQSKIQFSQKMVKTLFCGCGPFCFVRSLSLFLSFFVLFAFAILISFYKVETEENGTERM